MSGLARLTTVDCDIPPLWALMWAVCLVRNVDGVDEIDQMGQMGQMDQMDHLPFACDFQPFLPFCALLFFSFCISCRIFHHRSAVRMINNADWQAKKKISRHPQEELRRCPPSNFLLRTAFCCMLRLVYPIRRHSSPSASAARSSGEEASS